MRKLAIVIAALLWVFSSSAQEGDQAALNADLHFALDYNDELKGTYKYGNGNVASVILERQHLEAFMSTRGVFRVEYYPSTATLLADTMLINTRIDSVHAGAGTLPMPYTGSNVILGIIDAGIEYPHEDFKKPDGTSRILYLWDQILSPSNNPDGFTYGIEYTQADLTAGNTLHNSYRSWGHGTNVAGVAASDGSASNAFKGAAPDADIIFVNYNSSMGFAYNFSDAVTYIFNKAAALGRPCVINSSVGIYGGYHDGSEMVSQYINNLISAQPGRALVQAAGNGGDDKMHVGYNLNNDTVRTCFKYSTNVASLYFKKYADQVNYEQIKTRFAMIDATTGQRLDETPWYAWGDLSFSGNASNIYYNFSDNGQAIGTLRYSVVDMGTLLDMFAYVYNSSSAYYLEAEYTGVGKFDIFTHKRNLGTSDAVMQSEHGYLAGATNYVDADTMQSIVGYWNCSPNVISVANYTNRKSYLNYNGNPIIGSETPGELAHSSSNGPTRDGRLKPEISSAGNFMLSTGVAAIIQDEINAGYIDKVAQTGKHRLNGGTSLAAPTVAGGIALYLERYPNATIQQIRDAVFNNARVDAQTLDSYYPPLPNNHWGYGKFDAFKMMQNSNPNSSQEIQLLVHANLEGVYDAGTGAMDNTLFQIGLVPTIDPNAGLVNRLSNTNTNIVDWVMVELRDPSDETIIIASTPGLIHTNGLITDPFGASLRFDNVSAGSYYLSIQHRNHLPGVMKQPITFQVGGAYGIDLREDSGFDLNGWGQKSMANGKWAMFAGNVHDEIDGYDITGADKADFSVVNGISGQYLKADINMNGDITGADKAIMSNNLGIFSALKK